MIPTQNDVDNLVKNSFRANNLNDEFNDSDHYKRRYELISNLKESLNLIGDGEVIEESKYDFDGDRLIYRESFNNESLLLVVHARFVQHRYCSIGARHFLYNISVFENKPETSQIGGGYGASGIITTNYPRILICEHNYCRNKNVISKVCIDIKKYVEYLGN